MKKILGMVCALMLLVGCGSNEEVKEEANVMTCSGSTSLVDDMDFEMTFDEEDELVKMAISASFKADSEDEAKEIVNQYEDDPSDLKEEMNIPEEIDMTVSQDGDHVVMEMSIDANEAVEVLGVISTSKDELKGYMESEPDISCQ